MCSEGGLGGEQLKANPVLEAPRSALTNATGTWCHEPSKLLVPVQA